MTTLSDSQVEAVVNRAQQIGRLTKSERRLLVRAGAKAVLESPVSFRSREDVERHVERIAASFGEDFCRDVADEACRRLLAAFGGAR